MRLAGRLFDLGENPSPEEWIEAVRSAGYRAAAAPVTPRHADADVHAFVDAAREADVVIDEVGAWSNPLSPDEETRRAAIEKCKDGLHLADRLGARCCVNISGSRGEKWDGPHPDNLTDETFDMIVGVVRDIIDTVGPTRTFYTLETMPWMYPDSAESYERLIGAIDRTAFAVHFDPVNLICSPQRYIRNGELIRDFVETLGPRIRSCHAKDILLRETLTTHLDEVPPGQGGFDYHTFLREVDRLDPDMPVRIEHLSSEKDFRRAADHIRSVAGEIGVAI